MVTDLLTVTPEKIENVNCIKLLKAFKYVDVQQDRRIEARIPPGLTSSSSPFPRVARAGPRRQPSEPAPSDRIQI